LTQTDQAGHVTKYEYDLAGPLLKTTVAYGTADAATTLSSYDVAGRRTTSTDARGTVTTSTFDDAGRLIGITDALHHSSTFTYDAAGRQVTVTDPLGRTTQTAYDARGRVTQVTYPDGTTTSSTYDGVGQVIALTDQAGQVTHYAFDAGGQMLSVTDALNQATNYAYDANGNRLSRTDANNHTATYTYDVVNRMKTRTLPGGGNAESFSYNLTGTTASVMDFNGKTTTFGYDKLDRLLMRTPDVSFGEAAVSFTYTSSGRRLTMTDGSGTTSYGYDNQDRLVSKTNGAGTLTYTYDTAGNRLTMVSSNANGTNAGYSYDELNRLKTVTDNGAGATTTYSYDVAGNLSGTTLPNGVQIAPQLDAMNRVTGLPVTSKPAANYNYTYGLVGNRLVASDSNGSSHYTYNSVYRLTEEAVSRPQLAGTLNYGLDPVGNRLSLLSTLAGIGSQTASYDANDRVTTNSYDNNGNTLTAGSRTFRYDSMDRMTNFNSGAATMVYDGDGNRVSKTSGGAATVYLVDEGNPTGLSQVVEEIVGGVVKRRYTYGQGRISQTQAGVTSYYGYDGHGDVRFLMDGTGTVTDTYDYDAWGNLVASTGTTPNVYRYQGEALDSETGLYYLRARYYDPLSGRFLSVDPMADEGEHPYTYAGADPVNGRDPTGTQDILEYRWLSPGPVTFIAVALLFSVEDLEAQGGSPGTPTGRMPPGPTPGGPPKKKCCEGALRDEVNRFLHRQAPSFINWEPNMAGLAVAAGKLDNVDPRLLVAIPALEGGNGKHFGHNNPFGLMDKKVLRHFSSPADAIQADADNLALHIYAQHQSTVALLYAGNTWVYKGARHWPQYVIDFPAYCVGWNPATQKMDPAFTKACQVAGRKIAGFLSSMTGDKESNLRPGNPNDLSYPCPR
jgi:RHS repeat-associated protein